MLSFSAWAENTRGGVGGWHSRDRQGAYGVLTDFFPIGENGMMWDPRQERGLALKFFSEVLPMDLPRYLGGRYKRTWAEHVIGSHDVNIHSISKPIQMCE